MQQIAARARGQSPRPPHQTLGNSGMIIPDAVSNVSLWNICTYAKYTREAHRATKIGGAKTSSLRRPISVGSTSWRCINTGWLSVIRPENGEGAQLNIELPNCQGSGRTTESQPNAGSTFAGHRSVDDVTESDRQNTDGGEQRQPLQALQESDIIVLS
jgi:hypothetical protein